MTRSAHSSTSPRIPLVRGYRCSSRTCHTPGLIQEQLLYRNVQRFRGWLVFEAHRLLYHSTLGLRVIKKRRRRMMTRSAHLSTSPRIPRVRGYRCSSRTWFRGGLVFEAHRLLYHSASGSMALGFGSQVSDFGFPRMMTRSAHSSTSPRIPLVRGYRCSSRTCHTPGLIQEQLLYRNVQRFQGWLVVKAHRRVYH